MNQVTVADAGKPHSVHLAAMPGFATGTPGTGRRMSNVQQPEQRRSGRDPLVQDSVKDTAASTLDDGSGDAGPVPPDQRSPYGPQPPRGRRPDGEDPA
jgi:hypothetical protein